MSEFEALTKRLWLGTLLVDLLILAWASFFKPHWVYYLAVGMLFSVFFLWSLAYSAKYPSQKLQFAFSLARMVFIAYIVSKVGHFKILETTIVICGLLSYKVVLTAEYIQQGFIPAFKSLRRPQIQSRMSEFPPESI